jgi:hypothetical protein
VPPLSETERAQLVTWGRKFNYELTFTSGNAGLVCSADSM